MRCPLGKQVDDGLFELLELITVKTSIRLLARGVTNESVAPRRILGPLQAVAQIPSFAIANSIPPSLDCHVAFTVSRAVDANIERD